MATGSRGRSREEPLNPWPGYVDALSTLLMVIIFVLLVFVLAQAFLSVVLSGRNKALDVLNHKVAELSDLLSLERGHTTDLKGSLAGLNRDLAAANAAKDALAQQLAALRANVAQGETERAALKAERDSLAARLSDATAQTASAATRAQALQAQLAEALARGNASSQQSAALVGQLADAKRELADTQQRLAAIRAQMAELDKTVTADKATIDAKLSDLARLSEQVQALTALRDELERQTQDAAARATTEQQRRVATEAELANEKKFSDSARAQIALLNQQLEQMRAQLKDVATALDIAEKAGRDKDTQIANLGQRLNAALAAKVEELQRYRSEFFGRLRDVLANQKGIQVVGDRFVIQSEVLFPTGSADLTPAGVTEVNALAGTLKKISSEIPGDLPWVLRVDGHADRQPVVGGTFASNWELSAQRAINVVKLLALEGVPPNHLAATAFAEYEPIAAGDAPEDYAKNRRIELRLTDR